jgi:hypothetical protein
MSYLSHLECPECGRIYAADELNTICAPYGRRFALTHLHTPYNMYYEVYDENEYRYR